MSTCRGPSSSRRAVTSGADVPAVESGNGHASTRRSRRTIDDLLEEARRGLCRLTAAEAWSAVQESEALLIDTRSEDQRAAQGYVRAARHIPLSVLEWRLDPASGYADEDVTPDTWLVLICREGYSSSLAAARLQALGFTRVTDVIDGVEGWKAAGLEVSPSPT